MTTEKQRIAIAEACGWKPGKCPCGEDSCNAWKTPAGDNWEYVPDYLNDLNAMHEAEKVLTYEQAEEFVEQLYLADQKNNLAENPPPWRFNVASATAIQRAEAFLRTVGKWEDDE
jgi:hypothetical protein